MPRQLKDIHRTPTNPPLAYFITFRTYGTWLHGDPRTSVDRNHNTYGAPRLEPNEAMQHSAHDRLKHDPITLDGQAADLVEKTVTEVCATRSWQLFAVKMRNNHLHVVVLGPVTPERILEDLKAWATRRLREHGFIDKQTRPWVRHGSTPYLWTPEMLHGAIDYVLTGQGPLLFGQDPERWHSHAQAASPARQNPERKRGPTSR
jgi:REP element-mobilizing transposase RayT